MAAMMIAAKEVAPAAVVQGKDNFIDKELLLWVLGGATLDASHKAARLQPNFEN